MTMLARRALLAGAASLVAERAAAWSELVGESPAFASLVAPGSSLRPVFEGGRWCEGPVWAGRFGGLVFSDVRSNRMLCLGSERAPRVVRDPSGYANGNALDREGRLVTCQHGGRRVVRAETDGRLTVLADSHAGRPLNAPNDVVVAADGAIWFTDPTFGLTEPEEGRQRPAEQPGRFLFRLAPDGRLAIAADTFEQPNGLAFSPDGRVLYVSDTSASDVPDGRREIRAFDARDGGRLSGERVFATLTSGVPDGLKTDQDGRVYAATADGVRIWEADGTPLGRIATPSTCGNLAFGGADGRRLFACCGAEIHAIDLTVRGADWRA